MADPSSYRPRPGEIPQEPGVYRFRDKDGRVIYVGKAKSLRSRLSSYFQDTAALHPRTRSMVAAGVAVEWTVVANEVEALQLEYSWIKAFDPRFNVKYRDDKSYPYLAVTMGEEFPRAQVLRGAKRPGTRYFGPYAHAWAIRETLDLLLRVFPLRTCSNGVFRRAGQVGRPCLLGYIDKCSAPCVGRVDAEHHRVIAEDFCDFMGGSTQRFVTLREREMRNASAELDFERAARLRDDIVALNTALERSTMVLPDGTDADVFAIAGDELEAAVQVFHIRGGRVRGQRGWVLERQDEDDGLLIEHLIQRVYGDEAGDAVPREVLVPSLPVEPAPLSQWLAARRGTRVDVRVPRRGDKRSLMDTVERNAQQSLARHKVARAGDLTARGQALQELQDGLGLDEAPLRIECYDISHVQGSHPVGSMVVFEDGLPRKSEYRRFLVKGQEVGTGRGSAEGAEAAESRDGAEDEATDKGRDAIQGLQSTVAPATVAPAVTADESGGTAGPGPAVVSRRSAPSSQRRRAMDVDRELVRSDDTAAMREVLTRRFRRLQEGPADDADAPGASLTRRFVYPPHLVVVDGGRAQVDAAAAALADVGAGHVQVVGLAKRLEEVWLPGEEFPVVLPRTSDGLFLLQRLRDEAHRFAITFHRQRRSKAMTTSALDRIPGLGPARKAALLKKFGSVKRLRQAEPEELCAVAGIGPILAQTIHEHLATSERSVPSGVNLATGEVVE